MTCNDSQFCDALRDTLVEYFQKTSLNGFGLLYYIRRRKYQRTFWFLFILLGIGSSVYVVLCTLLAFMQDPTVTSLVSQCEPIWQTPFPSVVLCSANMLSRRAVIEFQQEEHDASRIVNWLTLQENKMNTNNSNQVDMPSLESKLDVPTLLARLSPDCASQFLYCSWAGRVEPCSSLWHPQLTALGRCCRFNWQFDMINATNNHYYPAGTGPEMGLTVLLNLSTVDHYYTSDSSDAYKLLLVPSSDLISDVTAGSLPKLMLSGGQQAHVALKLTTQVTTAEARYYSPSQRRCYFADEPEAQLLSLGPYSQRNCWSTCRIQRVRELCNCLPFYVPEEAVYELTEDDNAIRTNMSEFCPLAQEVHCVQSLKSEVDDEQECMNRCLPLCSYNSYHQRKWQFSLRRRTSVRRSVEKKVGAHILDDLQSVSMVTLFFPSPCAMAYRKNVLYNWYQILSNIGGVIGICMGCSCISGCELIYFLVYRLFERVNNKISVAH